MNLAMTVTGTGDDGKEYTINGYKNDGDALISHVETTDGQTVHCESENPLVFFNATTRLKIRCPQQ